VRSEEVSAKQQETRLRWVCVLLPPESVRFTVVVNGKMKENLSPDVQGISVEGCRKG
jgi:hypothetical protein